MSWTLIEHQALTSSAASVTLGSGGTIPQTYKTLKLVISPRTNRTASAYNDVLVRINSTTTGYTTRWALGSGSAASSGNVTVYGGYYVGPMPGNSVTASTFGSVELTIPNYTDANNKTASIDAVSENNGTESYQFIGAGLLTNTAAVTSLLIRPETADSFVSGCTFTLYGLA